MIPSYGTSDGQALLPTASLMTWPPPSQPCRVNRCDVIHALRVQSRHQILSLHQDPRSCLWLLRVQFWWHLLMIVVWPCLAPKCPPTAHLCLRYQPKSTRTIITFFRCMIQLISYGSFMVLCFHHIPEIGFTVYQPTKKTELKLKISLKQLAYIIFRPVISTQAWARPQLTFSIHLLRRILSPPGTRCMI